LQKPACAPKVAIPLDGKAPWEARESCGGYANPSNATNLLLKEKQTPRVARNDGSAMAKLSDSLGMTERSQWQTSHANALEQLSHGKAFGMTIEVGFEITPTLDCRRDD
jgi:hypothetical protein